MNNPSLQSSRTCLFRITRFRLRLQALIHDPRSWLGFQSNRNQLFDVVVIGNSNKQEEVEMERHPGIRIDRIPVEGIAGFIFMVGIVALILTGLPSLRLVALICMLGGAIGAFVLFLWHKYR